MKTNIHFWSHVAHLYLQWEMFQTEVVEKIKTHILCSKFYFRKPCRLCDTVKNIVERGRPQMTIRRMRIACWIPKATNTHSACEILIGFPLQQWLYERYTYSTFVWLAASNSGWRQWASHRGCPGSNLGQSTRDTGHTGIRSDFMPNTSVLRCQHHITNAATRNSSL